jgi:hypothetical protein
MLFAHSGAPTHIALCFCGVFLRLVYHTLFIVNYPFGTDPGSFKLTYISYRWRFSFVSFACIVRSFFVFRSFVLPSCNSFVCFVHCSFRSSV